MKFHEFFWDEAVYVGMGKYLFSSGTVGLWESIRPPVLPVFLGAIWRAGLVVSLYGEILVVLFSAGLMILTYLIAGDLFGKKTATLSLLILASTPVFFKFSSLFMTGILSAFFAFLASYIYIKKRSLFWVGVFAGISFLTRYIQGIMIASIAIMILADSGFLSFGKKKEIKPVFKRLAMYFLGIMLALAPFLAFNIYVYRDDTANLYHAAFRPFILASVHQSNAHEAASGFVYNSMYYFIELFNDNSLLAFGLVGVVSGISLLGRKRQMTCILLPLILYLLYFSFIVNKQLRFSLVFLPIVAILAAEGLKDAFARASRLKKMRAFVLAALCIFVAFSVFSVMDENWNTYHYRASGPPEIVSGFYLTHLQALDEPVLTSDPTSIAYIDKLMLPYYSNNVEGPKIYDEKKGIAGSIVYNPSVYPCLENDIVCEKRNSEFFERLKSENRLLYTTQYYGERYYLFAPGNA